MPLCPCSPVNAQDAVCCGGRDDIKPRRCLDAYEARHPGRLTVGLDLVSRQLTNVSLLTPEAPSLRQPQQQPAESLRCLPSATYTARMRSWLLSERYRPILWHPHTDTQPRAAERAACGYTCQRRPVEHIRPRHHTCQRALEAARAGDMDMAVVSGRISEIDSWLYMTAGAAHLEAVTAGGRWQPAQQPPHPAFRAPQPRLLPAHCPSIHEAVRQRLVGEIRLQCAAECALATMQPYGDDVFRESEPRRDLGLWPLKQVALNQYLPCWGRKQRQRAIKQLRQLRALQLKLDVIHIRHILTGCYDPIHAARRAVTLD